MRTFVKEWEFHRSQHHIFFVDCQKETLLRNSYYSIYSLIEFFPFKNNFKDLDRGIKIFELVLEEREKKFDSWIKRDWNQSRLIQL